MLRALVTDVDGTLTGPDRRIDFRAVETIRGLVDRGIEVVLASGNTPCFMDALCKMVGTRGTFIAENGGVFRIGYGGTLSIRGDQPAVLAALGRVQEHFRIKGVELDLYSPTYRFSDRAFARTVPADEVRAILAGTSIQVIDTGFAIHLHSPGISKGTALLDLAPAIGLSPSDFLAVGDSVNDLAMLQAAGTGVTVANAHPDVKAVAAYVAEQAYGGGFAEAVKKYEPYLRAR